MKFDIYVRFENFQKIQVPLKSDKETDGLHEDQYTFLILSRSFLRRMRNISHESCRENQKVNFIFNNFFFMFMRESGKMLLSRASHRR
jgi:hypothetical protein